MPVLVNCKFDEDPIKIEVAIERTFPIIFLWDTKGQVTLM